jgi:hypothetical protein
MSDDFDDGSSAATGDRDLDPERRAALQALARYSGAAGVAATLTVLSAEDVLAEGKACSFWDGKDDVPAKCRTQEADAAGMPRDGGLRTFGSDADTVIFGTEPDSVTDPEAGWIHGDG